MLKIGCHLSSAKGFEAMGNEALSINANTFQFFVRNPRGGSAKEFDERDAEKLSALITKHNFAPVLAHAPYTMNCASKDERVRSFAIMAMQQDLYRVGFIKNAMYNFHPGCHVGAGAQQGIQLIANALDEAITAPNGPLVLLETMAGKGSEIGANFEELAQIISKVNYKERVGVCMDTCHVFDGGYNIVNNLDNVLTEFDSIVGLDKLCAVHLNDSLHGLSSHKDRHAKIGQGHIGLKAFSEIINHSALKGLPFYLETPCTIEEYAEEIKLLRGLFLMQN